MRGRTVEQHFIVKNRFTRCNAMHDQRQTTCTSGYGKLYGKKTKNVSVPIRRGPRNQWRKSMVTKGAVAHALNLGSRILQNRMKN